MGAPKLKTWEYKLSLVPSTVSHLATGRYSGQVETFFRTVFDPARDQVQGVADGPPSNPQLAAATVAFFDTSDFTYYGDSFAVRWRYQPEDNPPRYDLTVKNRGTDVEYDSSIKSDEYGECNDVKYKGEYKAVATDEGSQVSEVFAYDNEFKSTTSDCGFDFSDLPVDAPGWADLFPILEETGAAGDVVMVNGIRVGQYSLPVRNLLIDGVDGGIECDLTLWVNTSQSSYGELLAAEFAFTVKHKALTSGDTPPEVCLTFLEALGREANRQGCQGESMKTHAVYYPPSASS